MRRARGWLLAAAVALGGCATARPPARGAAEGAAAPVRLRFRAVRFVGAASAPAVVTVNGAADLDGAEDRRWGAVAQPGPGGLSERFVAGAGTATVTLDVRAVGADGRADARRFRVRLRVE